MQFLEKNRRTVEYSDRIIEENICFFGNVSENDQRSLTFKIVGYINDRDRLGH